MNISIETAIKIGLWIAVALFIVNVILHDQLVRSICKREGRQYSFAWPFWPPMYWLHRIGFGFGEAKKAGIFRWYLVFAVVAGVFILVIFIAGVSDPTLGDKIIKTLRKQ